MRNERVRFISVYNSAISAVLRFILVNLLLFTLFFQIRQGDMPNFPLFALSLFAILELFVKFGIGNIPPFVKVSQNPKNIYDSFTKEALESFLFKENSKAFLSYILKFPQAEFILQKAVIDKKELGQTNLNSSSLAEKALEIAKKLNGDFVTTGDLL